jgi:hypothetical protein
VETLKSSSARGSQGELTMEASLWSSGLLGDSENSQQGSYWNVPCYNFSLRRLVSECTVE